MTKLVASAALILSLAVLLVDPGGSAPSIAVASQPAPTSVTSELMSIEGTVGNSSVDEVAGATLVIVGGSPVFHFEIHEAARKFAAAGLELPHLTVNVHADDGGCDGAAGLFRPNSAGDSIDLCREGEALVLHELAHAWARHVLSNDDRAAFTLRTGLPTWKSHSQPHGLRASEVAAEAIAFGLRAEPLSDDEARRALTNLEHFQVLTGFEPPRLVTSIAAVAAMPMPTVDPVQVSIYAAQRGA